jgi:hypothetical protein
MLDPVLVAHLAVTWALVGLIWVVQLAIYPQFARIGGRDFRRYHDSYTTGITAVVAPAMGIELLTGAWLLLSPEQEANRTLWAVGFALIVFNFAHTALISVPLHGTLSAGFDELAHRRLVRANLLRTAAWTARGALVVLALL